MLIQRYKSNPDGNFEVDLIDSSERDFVREPYTLVEPPVPNWKPVFDFEKNEWIETLKPHEIDMLNAGARNLDELKKIKKDELSQACQDCILDGFISKVDGINYHFSYDREAQMNYQERWQLFQNNMIKSIIVTAHNVDDKSVVRVSVDKLQFNSIYLDSIKHKEDCINRLHDVLIPLVEETETVEELEEINWNMQLEETDKPTIEVKDDKLLSVLINTNQEKQLLLETAVMEVAMQVYQ